MWVMKRVMWLLGVGISHGNTASFLVWCPWALYKWRYVFDFSRDLRRRPS